ncbi:hypothetical protein TRIUR3_17098 [Triticum urartu]|uniref:Uncharacterized protein n=1 Tax=Triticum urartu TaxID=4572 RepID=M7ZQJ8_TRIUA|nr:hypothetical protein TRIUR3_17098 [Triticum urartu]
MAPVIGEFATAYLHLMCGIFLTYHDSMVFNERYTTTIAGGYSAGTGHRDEPAQNATFSPDFELTYIPKICALLVADRGNRLIRQIKLKPEDCAHENQKDMAGTTTPAIGLDNEALPSTELLGDFVGFDDSDSATDEGNESAFDGSATQDENKETSLDRDLWALLDNPQGSSKKIDNMIEANLLDFSGQDKYCSPAVNYSGVSRRFHGGSKVL